MPLYEYGPVLESDEAPTPCCSFETLQKSSEQPLQNCPTCGHPVQRLFSACAIASQGFSRPNPSQGQAPSASCASGACGYAHATPSNTPAGRALQNSMGHVCRAGCKH